MGMIDFMIQRGLSDRNSIEFFLGFGSVATIRILNPWNSTGLENLPGSTILP